MYHDLYDRAKNIIKKDACMKFYNAPRPLYLKTYATGVNLGARLLQVRDGIILGMMIYQTMQLCAQLLSPESLLYAD